MVTTAVVGILALQGSYQRHADLLEQLGVAGCLVRSAGELERCAALILPGGESTTMTRLLQAQNLLAPLRHFARTHPLLGTCAGLILMGRVADARVTALEVLDVEVARNAYGRQLQSFQCALDADLGRGPESIPAVFIRAPQISAVDATVEILARHQGAPVLVAQGRHLGMSFHPELSDDTRIHRYWLERAGVLQPREERQGAAACG